MKRMSKNRQSGFTIVELLIVIVVIGILAAITIVAYNGIQKRATGSALQSDLKNASTQLEATRVDNNDQYPTNGSSLKASNGTVFTYVSNGTTYCLQATNSQYSDLVYKVDSQTKQVQQGQCGNSFANVAWQPTTHNFPGSFYEMAVSTDGQRLIASTTTANTSVYTSADGGQTWTSRPLPPVTARTWRVASSASGQYLAVATFSESVQLSSDYGVTWTTSTSGSHNYYDIDISDNGQVIHAPRSSGGVRTSLDGGTTWGLYPVGSGSTVASTTASPNGQFVLANVIDRSMWRSTNSGASWTQLTIPDITFYDMAISEDGSRIVAIGSNVPLDGTSNTRRIYVSDNGGSTWTEITAMGARYFASLTMSYDGMKLSLRAETSTNGRIYTSTNGGLNWTEQIALGTANWSLAATNSTGSLLFITQSSNLRVGTYD